MSGRASPVAVLARKRRWARLVLRCEQLATPLAPTGAILLALVCAGMLGGLQVLAPWPHLGVLAGALAAAVVLAWTRVAPLGRPDAGAVDRRLEQGAGDPHRPLAALADRPAVTGAELVWQVHQARALARIGALRAGGPRLRRAEAMGLAGAVLVLLGCAVMAGPGAPGRLWAAFNPRLGMPVAPTARVQATIVAPAGLGVAPVFLGADVGAVMTVPVGSRLSVTVLGGGRLPVLTVAGGTVAFRRLDAAGYAAGVVLSRGGVVRVTQGQRVLGQWTLDVAADQPPRIRLAGVAGVRQRRAVLPWTASDDHGLAGVTAEIRLRDRPAAAAMVIPLTLAMMPRQADGGVLPDLTAHPWAGLPVRVRYVARDGGGQQAASGEAMLTLPERVFANPLARALIKVRRGLSADPGDVAAAAQELDRLSSQAAGRVTGGQWLNLRAAAALLDGPAGGAQAAAQVPVAQTRLWTLALSIEDGGTGDARRALADARHALEDALAAMGSDRQQRIEAASTALRAAIGHYLQALQQQAVRSDAPPPAQADGRSVDSGQIDQMTQQLADAARSGRTDAAAAQLRALGALLDGLHVGGLHAGGQRGKAGGTPDPALSALLHDQDQLRARAEGRLSQDGDPRAGNAPERDPDEAAGAPDPAVQRGADAAAQARLRARLGDLAGKLGETTGRVPDGLAQADGAMQQAAGALARGNDTAARAAQQRALDGLRQGGQQLAGQAGDGSGGIAQPGAGTDPLGRAEGAEGSAVDADKDARLPSDADAARGRALRDELRRRAADRTRPAQELDYIDRLLKPQ